MNQHTNHIFKKGFILPEILLVVSILGLVGGWYVYGRTPQTHISSTQTNSSKEYEHPISAPSMVSTPNTELSTTTPASADKSVSRPLIKQESGDDEIESEGADDR